MRPSVDSCSGASRLSRSDHLRLRCWPKNDIGRHKRFDPAEFLDPTEPLGRLQEPAASQSVDATERWNPSPVSVNTKEMIARWFAANRSSFRRINVSMNAWAWA
jgi:hypothetical protein